MVHIFYFKSRKQMRTDLFDSYMNQLPVLSQKKILLYKHWQDAERSLAGNILLKKGLEMLDIKGYPLSAIKRTKFDKPYFDDNIHFNISHSGLYTICAISETNTVGIDVEQVNEIPLTDFNDFFYKEEWQNVLTSSDRLKAFYTLWTKKEAFLKVIGAGLNVPLNKVVIKDDTIHWENADWLLQEINLEPTHICYLCTNPPFPAFYVKEMLL
ncbi:mutanobactin A biosynthesis phosphopantetheinyl transferase MubP [soil metagenome]